MPDTITNKDLGRYVATWGEFNFGYTNSVDPSQLQLLTVENTVANVGRIKVGEILIGMNGMVSLELEQVARIEIEEALPWFGGTTLTDSIPLTPQILGKDLYDYADKLTLHPVVDGETTTRDITLLKVTPKLILPRRTGAEFASMRIDFTLFPDRTLLATNGYPTYGYIGPVPTPP